MHAALAAGEPVDVEVGGIAADSLGPRRVGGIAFAAAARWVDQVVLVSDDAIRDAQRRLWRDVHVIAEPGAPRASRQPSPARTGRRPASGSWSWCAGRTRIRRP